MFTEYLSVFITATKHHDQKIVGEERVYSLFIIKENQDQNSNRILEEGADAEAIAGSCLLAPPQTPDLLSPSFYRTQDLQPRNGTTHFGLDPLPLITK